ncbi:CBS domain-containing protein [Bacillus mojavensis]|uniref:CBS domain-containing protein n=1 Tax=Bacillus mojavensis TaxID=72360 RepID=UPI002DBF672A|nr:CBS domain-containing protein [Bacillus mojavensis]MEC1615053.1 CBS domain-containing protein [Bacillus mojavensis]MEC1623010.1 CBS domain-containing protein [Bacillus mojavensis]MEC1636681.1 CBS domain-containing protein [Bacillus mojavensis]MEC1659099.1 CBS domain-containing protein [Bacillus mojavensis]MEC1692884.1 CBS domain-containing protein [Bacillus mojavensis]
MSSVKHSMTTQVATVSPNQTIQEAASLMKQHNVGAIPVVEQGVLKGMLTDRDIALRTTAQGRDGQTPVSEVMSTDLVSGNPSMSLEDASQLMAQHQIRRLPIVDQNNLVGIVALGDLAVNQMSNESAGEALTNISHQNLH